MKVEEKTGIW